MDTNIAERDDQRARLTRAMLALKGMRSRLDAFSEPVAVIGLGCRYPGDIHDADSFWELLRTGRDAIREVPPDRWDADAYYSPDPDAPGRIVTRHGGFIDGIDRFDPHFFGIAPREAVSLDPQHRLLLEVAWEALETAGLAADRLRGSRTGVFAGIASNEYGHLLMAGGPEKIDSYMGSGNAHSVAAGRLSYFFGFEGPSLAVDTACSSSLVTVHLACQSLRLGECDLALAGGVNLLLTPMVSINHSRARMLAPDGRCKTFDAAADGFARSEGCGLVVLKRLSRALADGDPVMAVIRGSAINQDGHTSGLTVPSGPSQQAVIRQALVMAGVGPSEVSYVEAHGTGTSLGDPIELQALAAVFADRGPGGGPLAIGSVKTNFGHAEAAAGIAGLIKVVLALRHGMIPASLHFRQPNPRVAWDEMPVAVPREPLPWRPGQTPRIAGVSSFGFGGTNAHVVVAEPPQVPLRGERPERPLHLLALSAQSEEALKELAGRYAAHLAAHSEQQLGDLCHTANAGRSALRYRLCAVAGSAIELKAKLGSFAAGRSAAGLVLGKASPARPPVVAFLFTGQGAQYAGMARGLFETQPSFRSDLLACADLFRPHLDQPLADLLFAAADNGALDLTAGTQPALFVLEYCLGRLWMTWGVVPDLLLGHSLGEYAAACLAGVFSLEDGVKLIAARARLMGELAGDGAMAAVFAEEAVVRAALAAVAPTIGLAAINGPRHMVVSGPRSDLEPLLGYFAGRCIETHALKVSQAFHSALIDPMLAEFRRVAGTVAFSPPRLGLVSNLTGGLAGTEVTGADYWCRHAREPVRFLDGMCTLEEQGAEVFLEIGPHPILLGMGRTCVSSAACSTAAAWLPSLRRGQDDWAVMLDSLAVLSVRGAPIDWREFDAPYGRRRIDAPTYPFQRQRYWAASAPLSSAGTSPPDAEPGFYELRWLPQPRLLTTAPVLPEPSALSVRLQPLMASALADTRLLDYVEALAGLDRLVPGYIAAAFRQLGWPYRPGDRASTSRIRQTLGIAEPLTRLLDRLLTILAEQRVLRRGGEEWEIVAGLPAGPEAPERAVAQAEAELLDRCGTHLADVLTGRSDPLHLLFPDGERGAAASIYHSSPGAAAMHGLLRAAIARVRESWPADRPLRVLEVGAGTGGATAHVLPELPAGSEYVYSDISVGFFAEARTRFADYPFIRYETLDIERAPDRQGFAGREFDVVIAFNVLHATRSLAETVAHIRQLLAPGGLLLMLENTAPAPWVDLIWGLTPGWWRFADLDLRPSYPLLTAEQWCRLLEANGFAAVESIGVDPRRHEVLGRQALLVARKAAPAEEARSWLILADAGGVGDGVASLLRARGDHVVLAEREAASAGDFRRLLNRFTGQRPLSGVLHLWSLDAGDPAGLDAAALTADAVALAGSAVSLVQGLAAEPLERPVPVWLVTRGVQPAGDATALPAITPATLCGIGKVIAREHPEFWGGMIDLDPAASVGDAARIVEEVTSLDGEDHVAFRDGRRFAARLAASEPVPAAVPPVHADGTYLITGGCGALGLETARWLAGQGARRLVLVGRGGLATPAARDAVTDLERRGAEVRVRRADVADEQAMAGIVAEIQSGGFQMRGIVHAAGLPGRLRLSGMDHEALARIFAAKVAGSWVLHRVTHAADLDFFVCFSSMVSLWGAREQGHYVAANHFLDIFTHYRRRLGLPALCVNWGPLSGGGMLPPEDEAELRRIGVSSTPLGRAGDALTRLVGSAVAQAAVVSIDWPLFRAVYQVRGPCRMFDLLAGQPVAQPVVAAAAPVPETVDILDQLRRATAGERREIMVAHLQATLGRVLGLDPSRPPDCQQGFFDMGMDSLTAMEFRTSLQASLGGELPATLAFDYGTVDTLADFLLRDSLAEDPPAEAPEPDAVLAMMERLSDDEVEILLQAKLATL